MNRFFNSSPHLRKPRRTHSSPLARRRRSIQSTEAKQIIAASMCEGELTKVIQMSLAELIEVSHGDEVGTMYLFE